MCKRKPLNRSSRGCQDEICMLDISPLVPSFIHSSCWYSFLQMRKPRLGEIKSLSKVIANSKPGGWIPGPPPAQAQAPVSPEVFFPFPAHSLPNWVSPPDPVGDQGLMSAESLPCEEGPGLALGCVTTSTHTRVPSSQSQSCPCLPGKLAAVIYHKHL